MRCPPRIQCSCCPPTADVNFCQLLQSLPTLFPGTVPLDAQIPFVRADGTCGRALPPTGGGIFDLCAALTARPLGAQGVAGSSEYIGPDCQRHVLPGNPAPPPETPLTANDSSSIDFTTSGVASHTLTGSVRISAMANNQVSVNADGLFVPPPPAGTPLCTQLNALDSTTDAQVPATAELVYVRADGSCGRASLPPSGDGADIDVQNGLTEISPNLVEWGGTLLHDTTITQQGFTETHTANNGAGRTNLFVLSPFGFSDGAVNSPATEQTVIGHTPTGGEWRWQNTGTTETAFSQFFVGNMLLQVSRQTPSAAVASHQMQYALNALRLTSGGNLGPEVVLTPTEARLGLRLGAVGGANGTTYVECQTNRILLFTSAPGAGAPFLQSFVRFNAYANTRDESTTFPPLNFLYTDASGDMHSAPIAAIAGGVTAASVCNALNQFDTLTDFFVPVGAEVIYTRGDGTCGRAALPASGGGAFSCADLVALDTATDTSVPATAEVVYVRANGSCGRAPLPAGGGATFSCADLVAIDTATDTTVPATAEVIYVRTNGTCGRAVLPAGGGGNGFSVAQNGLTAISGTTVEFGGSLLHATAVARGSNDLTWSYNYGDGRSGSFVLGGDGANAVSVNATQNTEGSWHAWYQVADLRWRNTATGEDNTIQATSGGITLSRIAVNPSQTTRIRMIDNTIIFDGNVVTLTNYPNSRNDFGVPGNIFSTSGSGNLESHTLTELLQGLGFSINTSGTVASIVITHNLGLQSPEVIAYNTVTNIKLVHGTDFTVQYNTVNQVTVTFTAPTQARLRVL